MPSEDQIQGNTEGSQEGTQGQRQDPKARCSFFPFLQALPILGGQRLKDKSQGTRWLGQLCYASPLQDPETGQPSLLRFPSPSAPTSGYSLVAIEVAACFPEALDTRGMSGGRRRELAAGPVDFSLPLPNRLACRCHAEPRRRGRPYGHAPAGVRAARREEAPESPLS